MTSSPSEEHLPPTSGTESLLHSSSQHTSGWPGIRAGAGVRGCSVEVLPMMVQRAMVMAPVEPSTRSNMPVLMILVA